MTDFIDEIMGFNPQDLSAFNEPVVNNYDQNVYKTNPKDSKSEDGHYRSKLRIIYNPFDVKQSIVAQANYAMYDQDGFFMVKSKLANGDKDCPLFKSWKKLWFSGDEVKKEWAKRMYDKTESQWVLVQILEDENKPELVGQIKAMKLPKAIFNKMTAKMNPSAESKKAPVPVMDYLIGLPLEMDVVPGPDDPKAPERKQREISYDICDFDTEYAPIIRVDGTPLFEEAELETIDAYVTAKNEINKAKTAAKKEAAQKQVESLYEPIKGLYKKAMDYLKENSLDLVEECGYTEWDEATTKRVTNWINTVAAMQDPKIGTVNEVAEPVVANVTEAAPKVDPTDPFAEVSNEVEDLPF